MAGKSSFKVRDDLFRGEKVGWGVWGCVCGGGGWEIFTESLGNLWKSVSVIFRTRSCNHYASSPET